MLLGELAYHAWPLHGRPLDAARDVWRQVVALDSGDGGALQHAVRLEARAGDRAAVRALLARLAGAGADDASAAEARVIGALAADARADARADAATRRVLDALPEYSLDFLHGAVAGLLERPDAAEPIARRLTAPGMSHAMQGAGRVALAHLAAARGQLADAHHELDRAAAHDPVAAAWSRAYVATLPFAPAGDSLRREAARALAAARGAPGSPPLYLRLAVDASAAAEIDAYLAALLGVGDGPRCAHATPARVRELCADLRLGVAAESARQAGRADGALAALEALGLRAPYQYAGRSAFCARTRERYLRAELLERAGRLDEAYRWYASTPVGSRLDYVYLAPSHLGRGRIRERQGDRAGAAAHYRRVLALWRDPDPALAPLRAEAVVGLARLGERGGGAAGG